MPDVTSRVLDFHPGVEVDRAANHDYYETFDPAPPSRFEAKPDEQVERMELFRQPGAILFESSRRALLKRFPYMAVYLVGVDCIDRLAVLGVSRDPARIGETVSGRSDG